MKRISLNKLLTGILIFFLSIGLVGFFTPYSEWFKSLSFQNLLLTFLLVTISFRSILKKYTLTLILMFSLGYLCEVIGVNKGWIFGNYTYSGNLGLSILSVPLIIGINWAILTMGAWQLIKYIKINRYLQRNPTVVFSTCFFFLLYFRFQFCSLRLKLEFRIP